MKKLLSLSIIVLYLVSNLSCDVLNPCGASKDAFLENYNTLVTEASESGKDYSDDQWKAKDGRFNKMVEECYNRWEEDLSFREQRKFWGSALKYYYKRHGNNLADELKDEENTVAVKIQEELENVWGDSEEVLKDLFDELGGEEIEDLLKDIGKDVEKWGKKLEEIFKKK